MKFLSVLFFMSFSVFADFSTLSTDEVIAKIEQGVQVVDIRRSDEFAKYGTIKGAHKLTFFDKNGNYDAEKWLIGLAKIVKNKNDEFILVCAHANRTKTVGKFLTTKTDYKNVRELDGGINYGWIDKGFATTKISVIPKNNPWYKFW